MAIVECFRHWRHYLDGSQHLIEVWSDHMNLQGFMKQPRINGRQARWLIHLTPYDFIIRHRPGLLNPADGPSRRPDYMAKAQREPSLVQKDVLASKLEIRPDSDWPEATRADLPLCEVAKCQLCEVARAVPNIRLCDTARPARPYSDSIVQPYDTVRPKHDVTIAGSRPTLALIAGFKSSDSETGRLLELVRLQAVTRGEAKTAAQEEHPLAEEPAHGLIDLILKSQGTDPLCCRLVKELQDSQKPGIGRQGYTLDQQGLLRYKGRAVVPIQKTLIQELLYLYHDDQLAGHWGVDKTKELLERKFYWPGLATDVKEYVTTCSVCQHIAIPRHKPYGKLQPLPVPERPWQEVSLDFITQLPSSYIGTAEYDAILVVVDRYTKMARFVPTTTNLTAPEFAALFHENIELKYGSPRGIVSDRDTRITSKFWAEVCSYSLIKRRLSTAFHPQTDGQTEILNRVLEGYLRAYTSLECMNWARLLPSAEYAYNNSRSSSTKITPFKALYGYDPELRIDLSTEDSTDTGGVPAARDRIIRLSQLRETLRNQLLLSQERQAKYYNQRHLPKQFKRGNLVKLSTRNLRLRDKKLQPRWVGPFRILERIGSQAYRLALPEKYDRLHDVFPIQAIEEYQVRKDGSQELLPMPDLEDEEEWEVEAVKDEIRKGDKTSYLVKWKGWPTEYNLWVPEADMGNAQEAIRAYRRAKKAKQ